MSRWGNASNYTRDPVDTMGALQAGIQGYDKGQEIRREKEKRALGESMAAIPEFTPETQTDYMDRDTGSSMPSSGIPGGPGQPGVLKKSTVPATKDWKTWEDTIRKQAGAMGPEALQAAEAHITKTQQDGFTKDATKAAQLVSMGDLEGAEAALEKAYSSLPDGNSIDIQVRDGQLFAQTVDEASGKPEGEAQPIRADDITGFIQQMQDPVAWGKAIKEGRDAAAAIAEDTRQFETTETRLTKADEEKKRSNLKGEGHTDREIEERIRSAKAGESFEEQKIKETARKNLVDEGIDERKAIELVRSHKSTEGLQGEQLANTKAHNANMDAMAVAEHELAQHENLQEGAQRELERRLTGARITHLQAEADYIRAGKPVSGKNGYFEKRNDMYQRMNTAGASLSKAAEAIAPYQRKNKDGELTRKVPEAVQQAYTRELLKYDAIVKDMEALDAEELAGGNTPTVQAIPTSGGPAQQPVDDAVMNPGPASGIPTGQAPAPVSALPATAQDGGDGKFYDADGSVYDAQGTKLGSWK